MNGSKPYGARGEQGSPIPRRTHRLRSLSLFPSPRPSPQGRGRSWHRPVDLSTAHRLRTLFPLPEGEGQGEGKRRDRDPQISDTSRHCRTLRVPRFMKASALRQMVVLAGCVIAVLFCPSAKGEWWEHPHDKWYLKDD